MVPGVAKRFEPMRLTGWTSRVVEVRKTSVMDPSVRSEEGTGCSMKGMAKRVANSMTRARVTPPRHPLDRGGVSRRSLRTKKILLPVPSHTSPSSFMKRHSPAPLERARASARTFSA